MQKRTLVLNSDYLPYSIISWKRAFVQCIINEEMPGEGVSAVEFYKDKVRSAGGKEFPIPAVVRMARYINRSNKKVPFSRKNIFIRDNCTCLYCGLRFPPDELTYDHVIPKSLWRKRGYKGTPTNWENIVTACKPCNAYKGDSPLEKSGVRLLKQPKQPDFRIYVPGFWPYSDNIPEEWKPYLRAIFKDI